MGKKEERKGIKIMRNEDGKEKAKATIDERKRTKPDKKKKRSEK